MDANNQSQLKTLMEEYFGSNGLLILLSAVRKLGYRNLVSLEDDQKQLLINYLLDKVFSSVASDNKIAVLDHKLHVIFEVPEI